MELGHEFFPGILENDKPDSNIYDIPQYFSHPVEKPNKVCRWCGSVSKTGEKFCINCGTALLVQERISSKCPVCASTIEPEYKFCKNCGMSLDIEKKQLLFCTVCMAQIEHEDEFCVNCGYKLEKEEKIEELHEDKIKIFEKTNEKKCLQHENNYTETERIIPVYSKRHNKSNNCSNGSKLKSNDSGERIIPIYKTGPKIKFEETKNFNMVSNIETNKPDTVVEEEKMRENGKCPACGAEIINSHYCVKCLALFK